MSYRCRATGTGLRSRVLGLVLLAGLSLTALFGREGAAMEPSLEVVRAGMESGRNARLRSQCDVELVNISTGRMDLREDGIPIPLPDEQVVAHYRWRLWEDDLSVSTVPAPSDDVTLEQISAVGCAEWRFTSDEAFTQRVEASGPNDAFRLRSGMVRVAPDDPLLEVGWPSAADPRYAAYYYWGPGVARTWESFLAEQGWRSLGFEEWMGEQMLTLRHDPTEELPTTTTIGIDMNHGFMVRAVVTRVHDEALDYTPTVLTLVEDIVEVDGQWLPSRVRTTYGLPADDSAVKAATDLRFVDSIVVTTFSHYAPLTEPPAAWRWLEGSLINDIRAGDVVVGDAQGAAVMVRLPEAGALPWRPAAP